MVPGLGVFGGEVGEGFRSDLREYRTRGERSKAKVGKAQRIARLSTGGRYRMCIFWSHGCLAHLVHSGRVKGASCSLPFFQI